MSARFDCFAIEPGMVSLAEADRRLESGVSRVAKPIRVPLDRAPGMFLASSLRAPHDQPRFDNVAVDGYAFAGASGDRLRLLDGRAAAGHPFDGRVGIGEAVKVLTGAPMPEGADTVVMDEEVSRHADGTLELPKAYRRGVNWRRHGEDVAAGTLLFEPGQRLLPQHLGMAAALGFPDVEVFEPLRVALFSSGDELVEAGRQPAPGQIADVNRPMLRSLLAALPVIVDDLGILPDAPDEVQDALGRAARSHHVIIASGGASRGEEDHVVKTIQAFGRLFFWRIAMKPGRPLAFGELGESVFVGLPGNPVAAMVCFLRFARPVLIGLGGGVRRHARRFPLEAAFSLRKKTGRAEFLRGRLVVDEAGGSTRVERITREGSGILTSLTDADGLVELGDEVGAVQPGDRVPFSSFAEMIHG